MAEPLFFRATKKQYHIKKPIRLIELFAGYGSQALALKYLGVPFEHHFVCEFDKPAMASYNAVHDTSYDTCDIKDIHAEDLKITETDKYEYILTYSFPCTDLSIAGQKQGMMRNSGTSSSLLWEVERILLECSKSKTLPQVLVMENVKQVISSTNMPVFNDWLKSLESLGYQSSYQILKAEDYGCPQKRERCFMVSILADSNTYFKFPKKDITGNVAQTFRDCLETTKVDDKYYLRTELIQKGLASSILTKTISEEDLFNSEFPLPARLNRESIGGKFPPFRCMRYKDLGISHAGTLVSHYAKGGAMANGDNIVIDRDPTHSIKITPLSGVSKALDSEALGRSKEMIAFINQYDSTPLNPRMADFYVRSLTPLEGFRLMGVRDEDAQKMMEVNSVTSCRKQAGNSICVPVLMNIFKALIDGVS